MNRINQIGFGGGCHWCTEAVFSALNGVTKVEQGWIKSISPNNTFSEGVIVHFDAAIISAKSLIEIHLNTHSSTSNHSMRSKYRSAVYCFSELEQESYSMIINQLSKLNEKPYITMVLPFVSFKLNDEKFLKYYKKNKDAPFCQRYIIPKLKKIKSDFPDEVSLK